MDIFPNIYIFFLYEKIKTFIHIFFSFFFLEGFAPCASGWCTCTCCWYVYVYAISKNRNAVRELHEHVARALP